MKKKWNLFGGFVFDKKTAIILLIVLGVVAVVVFSPVKNWLINAGAAIAGALGIRKVSHQ